MLQVFEFTRKSAVSISGSTDRDAETRREKLVWVVISILSSLLSEPLFLNYPSFQK
jgi:hypothetical protein